MVVILCVVVFNAGLGFWQEHRAGKILDALKRMLAQQARVRRQGRAVQVGAEEVVPGDVVLLEAGDRVPADGILIAAHGVEIDESTLTGESVAVSKSCGALPAETPLAERANSAYMNTTVTRGRAELLVTGTGMATEMGRLVHLLQSAPDEATPLQARLDQLGKRLASLAGIIVLIILAMGLLRGEPLAQIILTSIALAVAAIPEGLPAVVTVTLAIGMYQMTRKGAIVKRLAAVETLGCTTVICSDKTGTLTLNQMTARAFHLYGRTFEVSGEGYAPEGGVAAEDGGPVPPLDRLLIPAALCNDARLARDEGGWRIVGDPTEGALLVLARKAGLDLDGLERDRAAEIPFDAERKTMATFHGSGEVVEMFVKGAPDVLLGLCSAIATEDGEKPLDEAETARLHERIAALGGRALRVLAVARRAVRAAEMDRDDLLRHHADLTFVGLIGLMDPPRPEAKAAVEHCRRAGIAVKMITGDHRVTAAAIARELGLDGEVVTGAEVGAMSDAELARRIDGIVVFARTAPEHKVRIVSALKRHGHVVAMTGDGVNDAAALRAADIGVAMGITGTDVTREAAAMVLTDDNFATIVGAVREGRTIYDNILKFVRFQLSTNVGALLTVFTAPLIGLPVPFHPIQILWVNIIMDGPPAMALAFDPPRPGLMSDKPRPPDEAILTLRRLWRLLAYGGTMMVGTLAVFAYALPERGAQHAGTLAFTTFVLFQFFNVFNARVGTLDTAFNASFFRNWKLWAAIGGVVGLQIVAVHWPPAQLLFHTVALSPADWALAAAVASSVLILDESRKLLQRLAALLLGADRQA
jgi:Ca2+-transporting ATPase